MTEPTIIREAVGLAHRPGCKSLKNDIRRSVVRALVSLSYLCMLPKRMRSYLVYWAWHVMPIGGASIGDTAENDLLKLLFNATAIANIADNAASAPLTNLYVSLHTADPGEAGTQTTNEIAYTSYARVAVARTTGGWTVTANSVSPVANIDFPAGTGGSGTATHFVVGTVISAAGKILFSGTVTPNITCGNGVTPRLTTASSCTLD